MRRPFAAILCISLFVVVSFFPQARAEEAGGKPELINFIHEYAFFAFEADVNKLKALGSSLPAKFVMRFLAKELRLGQQNPGSEIMGKILSLPWKGRIVASFVPSGPAMLVAGRIEGEAAKSLEAVFANSLFALPDMDILGHDVYSLPFRWKKKLYITSADDVIIASTSPQAITSFIENIEGGGIPSFSDTGIWRMLEPFGDDVAVRGALRFESLVRVAPEVSIVLGLFGLVDSVGLTYCLKLEGPMMHESLKLQSAGPILEPATHFVGEDAIPVEGSSIPNTAIGAVRMNIDLVYLFDFLMANLPQLDGGFARTADAIFLFLSDIGVANIENLLIEKRAEFFFDYPRGAVLPEFVLTIDVEETAAIDTTLALLAAKFELPRADFGGQSFFYIPSRKLPRDFPWGLAFGTMSGKIVLTSNIPAAMSALKRAEAAPLVTTQKYIKAMEKMPGRRSIECYVGDDALIGLLNVLKAASRDVEKALLPIIALKGRITPVATALGGTDTTLEAASSGTLSLGVTLMSAGILEAYFGMLRNCSYERLIYTQAEDAYKQLKRFYTQFGRLPVTFGEMAEEGGFNPKPFLAPGTRIPVDADIGKFVDENTIFAYFNQLSPDDKEMARYPVIITKRAYENRYIGCNLRGYSVSYYVRSQQLQRLLEKYNELFGTTFRIEKGIIVQ